MLTAPQEFQAAQGDATSLWTQTNTFFENVEEDFDAAERYLTNSQNVVIENLDNERISIFQEIQACTLIWIYFSIS